MSSAPPGAPIRRFVFLVSKTGDEVLNGAAVEVRAETAEEAIGKTEGWAMVQGGAELTLIGERRGLASSARFHPVAPIDELPMHILQNERFGGFAPNGCSADDVRMAEITKRLREAA